MVERFRSSSNQRGRSGIYGRGIDRNDFKVQGISEFEQAVVTPHAKMLTPGLRRHAQYVANILQAGRKRWRRDDYVVDM